MVTGQFAAYLILLMVTSVPLPVHDSYSESDEESKLLLGLSELWWSFLSAVSDFVLLRIQV